MSQIKKLQQGGTTLHYGTDKVVDAEEFNNKIASKVEDYIASQNWSKKEKQRFRDAYQDIMSRGVTGMEVVNGVRNTTYNGEQIDNKALAKKLRESYGNAAYFINEQLEASAYNPEERAKQEKEKAEAEEKARIAALPKFSPNDFDKFFIKTVFGGQENPNINDWDELDTVDPETKLRGIENRKQELSKLIDAYIQQLPEQNYEGSSFKNLQEYKEKLEKAKNSLQLGDFKEIKQALNAAGINWRHFLETDTLTPEGRQAFEQQKEQAAQEAAKQVEQQAKQEVKEDKEAEKESGIEIQEPVYEESTEKKGGNKYDNMGIAELWKKDPVYMSEMIGSLAADVASIIDPEPFSAAALGLVGAGARNAAASRAGEDWGIGDYLLQYGAGLVGAVPIVGDYALGARAAKTLSDFVKFGGKYLGGFFIAKGGKEVWDKITSGESLSFNDWKMVGDILLGLKATKGGGRSAKATQALNAARGLKRVGKVKFKAKDASGNIKEITADIKEGPDAEIWQTLKRKSHAEQKRILSENKSVQEALAKEGLRTDDIVVGKDTFGSRIGRYTGSGKADAKVTYEKDIYTKRLTKEEIDDIADENKGWFTPTEHNRKTYRSIYAELQSGKPVGLGRRLGLGVPFRRGRFVGKTRPTGRRAYEPDSPTSTPTPTIPARPTYATAPALTTPLQIKSWLRNNLANNNIFRTKKYGGLEIVLDNGRIIVTRPNSASGKYHYTIDTQNDLDQLQGLFGKNPSIKGSDVDRLFNQWGIFRQGGKIYNNLDAYLTDFIKRNK